MNTVQRGACAATVVGVGVWAVRDYRTWRALGEGGLPASPVGWLITTALRLAARDPFRVHGLSTSSGHRLANLPARTGIRPRVAPYPIPHRILGQPPADTLRQELRALFDHLASIPAVEYRTSRWERHHQALWLTATDREVAHLHPTDGSLHVVLDATDAQHVIDLGWGELHPLAGVPGLGLPTTYTLLYPPRGSQDVAVIRTLLTNILPRSSRAEDVEHA